MLPLVMQLKVTSMRKRGVSLWIPVIVVWVILWALMIVLFPLVLLAGLLTWGRDPGMKLLLIYPLLFSVLWSLSGLHIETRSPENEVLISFR